MIAAERVPSECSHLRYIADIFQNAVFFLSAPIVDSDALRNIRIVSNFAHYFVTDEGHSELNAMKCAGLSRKK